MDEMTNKYTRGSLFLGLFETSAALAQLLNDIKSNFETKEITLDELEYPYGIEESYRLVNIDLDNLTPQETQKIVDLLSEQRKLKVFIIMKAQNFFKLPPELQFAIRGNVQNYFVSNVTQEEENLLSELPMVNIIR